MLLAGLTAWAADWPQWRGPDRDGVSRETGLLKQWPKEGPPLLWTVTGCGDGFSSVAVVQGVIYGTGSNKGRNYLWARREQTGELLWSLPYSDHPGEPNSTPVIDQGKAYALTRDGDLACIDLLQKKVAWRKNYGKDFAGRMMSGWGYSETPLVDDEKLICTPGADQAAVVALNKDTGTVIWKCAVPRCGGAGYASPVKMVVEGVPLYVTHLGPSGGVVGVHAQSGQLLWQYTRVSNGTANIPTVVARGPFLFCSTGYDSGAALLRLQVEGKERVRVHEVKRHPGRELQNHHGGMVLVGDYLYLGHGHNNGLPTCVDFRTGEIVWKEGRNPGGGSGSAAVIAAEGMLYFRYQNGVVVLIRASPDGLEVAGSFRQNPRSGRECWAHPVIANGRLYLRDQDYLLCYDLRARR
ncbi:MAG: PQQ-binding-like beta-propeller repeat protein [Gemmataceae bacterium]|nr:PQQ-binding-like beta-propeller repeat protein [Gemmataceae bacterium]MCS7269653.1 PQQ-binding-like beta-propeller repeat protein [Gemmataceae bacterium]MDW8242116.1 PQQ-binding-like beta-propeller repeat protein [Thermogemmata sp.]